MWRVRRVYARDADISYGQHGAFNQLDIWRRPGLPRDARAPVLLQVPGGGWVIGNKQGQAYPLMSHLAEHGWVCVSMSYRLSPKATWPAQIVDVKRALRWVKEHIAGYGGDPRFVAITGGSAGGHLSALAALSAGDVDFQPGFEDADTTVQAAVPFYGIYDWTPAHGRNEMEEFLLRFGIMKQSYAEAPRLYGQASPLLRVGPHAPPFFVLHGDRDTITPVTQARLLVDRLRRDAPGPVVYAELPGAQHAFDVFGSPRATAAADAVARFLGVVYGDWARSSRAPA
jgi:acetyl esterase/lipase